MKIFLKERNVQWLSLAEFNGFWNGDFLIGFGRGNGRFVENLIKF